MKPKVQACLGQLIVSCQAYEDTPLYGAETMKKMVQSAMLGGAQAVRCCWPQDIRAARSLSEKLIIIGINKVMPKGEKKLDDVFITPTFEKAREVVEAGADILALDTRITTKRGKAELLALLHEIHETYPHIAVMADCATYEECRFCAESGCVDILSTTLSGYRASTPAETGFHLAGQRRGADLGIKRYRRCGRSGCGYDHNRNGDHPATSDHRAVSQPLPAAAGQVTERPNAKGMDVHTGSGGTGGSLSVHGVPASAQQAAASGASPLRSGLDFVYRFLFSLEWTAGRLVGCDRTLRLVDRQGQWLAVDDLSA